MTIETSIFKEENTLIALFSGVISGEDLVDFLFWLIREHKQGVLRDGYRLLIDTRDIEVMQVGEEDIHRLSQINMTFGRGRGDLKTAIVVESEVGYKLANLHKSLSKLSSVDVEVFEDPKDACAWLGFILPFGQENSLRYTLS